jgi:hypothetical protein
MARHNRDGQGEDQLGRKYQISYQPDWFYQIKVTRDLESGRQSTKTLCRNIDAAQAEPGPKVRTRIQAEELGLDFELSLEDAGGVIRRVTIETIVPDGPDKGEPVAFTISRRRNRRRAAPEG